MSTQEQTEDSGPDQVDENADEGTPAPADDDARLEAITERIDKARTKAEESGVLIDEDEETFAESGATEEEDDQTIAPPG